MIFRLDQTASSKGQAEREPAEVSACLAPPEWHALRSRLFGRPPVRECETKGISLGLQPLGRGSFDGAAALALITYNRSLNLVNRNASSNGKSDRARGSKVAGTSGAGGRGQ